MGNIVGSHETKFWQKTWVSIKASLSLTPRQQELIIGSLLGDGTMRIGKGGRNANFKVEHGLVQKELVEWKYQELKTLVFTGPRLSFRYRENGEKYPKSWWFRTIRHPEITAIYDQFYIGERYRTGKKIIPSSINKWLSPLAFATWIMDDGNYSQKSLNISTYSFSLEDIKILQHTLRSLYALDTGYYRDRDKGYRMRLNRKETEKCIQIISPHIIPSMVYKIGSVS
jgi:hypothetical protein